MMELKLVRKAISGDVESLSYLVDQYKDLAYDLAYNIVKNENDAKDITQESFLKVLENIHKFRNEAKFSTWLYRIIYNQSISFIKKKGKRNSIEINNEIVEKSTEENMDLNERDKMLHEAIKSLEDSERNVISLFYLAEKSVREIKIITGLSTSNIKVILHRSRKKLQKKLNSELWTNQIRS